MMLRVAHRVAFKYYGTRKMVRQRQSDIIKNKQKLVREDVIGNLCTQKNVSVTVAKTTYF